MTFNSWLLAQPETSPHAALKARWVPKRGRLTLLSVEARAEEYGLPASAGRAAYADFLSATTVPTEKETSQ